MSPRSLKTATSLSFLLLLLSVLLLPAASLAHEEDADAHKVVVQQLYDAFNTGKLDTMDAIFAADYVNHGFGDDLDLDALKSTISDMRAALPDFKATVEVLIAEGDWAASRVIFSGTFENEWTLAGETIPPTGEKVEWALNVLHHFNEDDRIAEDFTAFDMLGLLVKLGAPPVPRIIAAALSTSKRTPAVVGDVLAEDMEDAHKEGFTRVIEDSLNKGDFSAIDRYMADDYTAHEPFRDLTRDEFKQLITGFRATVPDLVVTIDQMVAEGDWLAARLIYDGTFTNDIANDYARLPATQKPIHLIINVFVRFRADGIGVEDFKEYNLLGWLRQAGLPLPPAA